MRPQQTTDVLRGTLDLLILRTLALVDAAIERAQNAELRAMLQTEVRPRVASHLDAARALQQRLGGR